LDELDVAFAYWGGYYLSRQHRQEFSGYKSFKKLVRFVVAETET
jgi:hypothetical protein